MEYHTIQEKNAEKLLKHLKEYLIEGWKILGEPTIGIFDIFLCVTRNDQYKKKDNFEIICVEGRDDEIKKFDEDVNKKLSEGFKILMPPFLVGGIVYQILIRDTNAASCKADI